MMQFFTKYKYSVGFPFVWWGIFSSIEWSEKNIKIFKIEKIAAVFRKILKMDFLEKATQIFFCGLSIIWTTYSPSLASGKKFLPIEKNIFEKKSTIVNFFKTTEERSKYWGLVVISEKKCCNKLPKSLRGINFSEALL